MKHTFICMLHNAHNLLTLLCIISSTAESMLTHLLGQTISILSSLYRKREILDNSPIYYHPAKSYICSQLDFKVFWQYCDLVIYLR